jgi:hypothetical protein
LSDLNLGQSQEEEKEMVELKHSLYEHERSEKLNYDFGLKAQMSKAFKQCTS